MEYVYQLANGRTLYYSSEHSRFWLDTKPQWPMPEHMDTTLYKLRMELSHQCNGYCRYCIVFGNQVQNFSQLHMSEVWEWLQKQEWFVKITEIFIIGGEPLMFFDDILYLLERFQGTVRFSTNGTMITPKIARILKDKDVLVYLSLDGPDPEDNEERCYRDGKPMYDDIIRGLHYLEEAGTRKGLFMVSTPRTVMRAAEIMEKLSHAYRIERIGYNLPHWTMHDTGIVTPEQYRDALCEVYRHKRSILANVMQVEWRVNPLAAGKVKLFSCALHTAQTTILPDWSIVRCSKIDHDAELHKISNSAFDHGCPIAQSVDVNSPCSSCVALGCCGGGCPYDGMRRFGTVIDQRECVITPAIVELAIRDIVQSLSKNNDVPPGLVPTERIASVLKGIDK